MATRFSFKWFSNVAVSQDTSFKDRYYFDFSEDKYNDYKEFLRQKFVADAISELENYVNQKVPLFLIPYLIYMSEYDSLYFETVWKTIIEKDLGITDTYVTTCCDCNSGCLTCLYNTLTDNLWNKDTLEKLANIIGACKDAGAPVNHENLGLFTLIYDYKITPFDFAPALFKDYLASEVSLSSYFVNTCIYPILVYLDNTLDHINDEVDDQWNDYIKTLIKSKLKDNLYDSPEKYVVINYIFTQINTYIRYLINTLNDKEPWAYSWCAKVAILDTLRVLANEILKSDDIRSTLENFDYIGTFTDFYNNYMQSCNWSFKQFDKQQLENYYNDVLANSDDNQHIHPALYPIWLSIVQLQDIKKDDYLGILYNSLKAIHSLSNFSNVDVDTYVKDIVDDTIPNVPNLNAWLEYIKEDLVSFYDNNLEAYVNNLQAEDWYYQLYINLFKLVLDALSDTFIVLIDPLMGELKQKYNLVSFEELNNSLRSSVYITLRNHLEVSLTKIMYVFHDERSKINDTSLDNALNDFENGTPKKLTSILSSLLDNVLNRYLEFLPDFNDIKYDIKQLIVQTIHDYAGSTQLVFDVLSENLDYLQNYDYCYGYFTKAFANKLKYILKKTKQQLQHALLGLTYKKIENLDYLSYALYPLIDLSTNLKQIEYMLIGMMLNDTFFYHARNVMDFPLHLTTPYLIQKQMDQFMVNDNRYRELWQSVFMC